MQTEIKRLILSDFLFKYNLWTRYYDILTKIYEKVCSNCKLFSEILIIRINGLVLNYSEVHYLKTVYMLCGVLQDSLRKFVIYFAEIRRYINSIYSNFSNVAILRGIKPVVDNILFYDLEHVRKIIIKKISNQNVSSNT